MKCTIPEISWHNRDPILSVDIQQNSNDRFIRLATAGADYHILIWQVVVDECGKSKLDPISDLTRHQRPVNIVRWSPSGQYLASGDDDANIIIWQLKTDNIPSLDGETNDRETWNVYKILRGHKEDVYDICWSPDSCKIVSGSIDNSAIIWNMSNGKSEYIFSESKGFVQGVSWDPKNQYIATLSSDRVFRVIDCVTKQVVARSFKGILPLPESHELHNKEVKYFHDDTFKSFFRRLSFSPDGNLLVTPSGYIESGECRRYLHASYIYTFDCLTRPAAILPLPKQSSVAVRFCPIFFELHPDGPSPFVDLPYRMIFAIATDSDVILYDTQQEVPFAIFQKIHYTRLTDLTWSADGSLLIASSTDGFCTIVTFDKDELGVPYVLRESEQDDVVESESTNVLEEQVNVVTVKKKMNEEVKPKKTNILQNWALKNEKINVLQVKKKQKSEETVSEIKNTKETPETLKTSEEKTKPEKPNLLVQWAKSTENVKKTGPEKINVLQPRRKQNSEGNCEKNNSNSTIETPKKVNILQVKRKSEKSPKINILQVKRKKAQLESSNDEDVIEIKETTPEEPPQIKDSEKINILQVKRKKTQTDSLKGEDVKVKTTPDGDKQEGPEKINILQVKRKKTEDLKSTEELPLKQEDKEPEVAKDSQSTEENLKKDTNEIIKNSPSSHKLSTKSPKVNILQVRRKPNTEPKSKKSLDFSNSKKQESTDLVNDDDEVIIVESNLKENAVKTLKKEVKATPKKGAPPKKPTTLERWAIRKPKNDKESN